VVGVAERDSWATMNGSTRVVDAEDARLAITALVTPGSSSVRGRQGLRPGPGNPGLVTATTPTPDINIKVEKFQAVITATRGLGEYLATLDSDKTINVLGDTPAHGSQQRNHLIIALQTDTYYADGTTKLEVIEVIGVAGAGDPSLAAYADYIPLARLRITAGASTVTSLMIDDLRPSWFVALGGMLPVKDQTERDALTAWDGFGIYRRDRNWREVHDGTAWRVQDVAVCSSVADRTTAVTHPYSGQLAMTTDTDTLWQYDGSTSAWVQVGGVKAPRGLLAAPVQGTSDVPISGTETLIDSITFSHVQGRYERFRFTSRFSLNTNGVSIMRFRYVSGAGPVNNTHTIAYETIPSGSGANGHMNVEKVLPSAFRALASNTYTVGVFATAAAGATSGTINGGAAGVERDFVGYDDGAP
jgi:hypothetical protein